MASPSSEVPTQEATWAWYAPDPHWATPAIAMPTGLVLASTASTATMHGVLPAPASHGTLSLAQSWGPRPWGGGGIGSQGRAAQVALGLRGVPGGGSSGPIGALPAVYPLCGVSSTGCLWGACGGRLPPLARAHQLGGRGVLPKRRSVPMERLRGTVATTAQAHQLGGRGVLPKRRSLPMERMRGTAAPKGAGPQARGRGILPRRWLGGLIPYLKGYLIPLPGCPTGRVPTGGHSCSSPYSWCSHNLFFYPFHSPKTMP